VALCPAVEGAMPDVALQSKSIRRRALLKGSNVRSGRRFGASESAVGHFRLGRAAVRVRITSRNGQSSGRPGMSEKLPKPAVSRCSNGRLTLYTKHTFCFCHEATRMTRLRPKLSVRIGARFLHAVTLNFVPRGGKRTYPLYRLYQREWGSLH